MRDQGNFFLRKDQFKSTRTGWFCMRFWFYQVKA